VFFFSAEEPIPEPISTANAAKIPPGAQVRDGSFIGLWLEKSLPVATVSASRELGKATC
jgi:hypothetical protein